MKCFCLSYKLLQVAEHENESATVLGRFFDEKKGRKEGREINVDTCSI
jgi:hypothetical protein